MPQRLRIFISSPADVPDERLRADLVVDKLAQDYGRFFSIEAFRWEHEAMLASAHFQDAIEPPSAFDIVVLILWSRLGTPLPERTKLREYRGIDGRVPVTGTEWEYEEALRAAREKKAPDLLAFRNISPAPVDPRDPFAQTEQLKALNGFWSRHFADRGVFLAAYDEYRTLEEFARRLEQSLRKLIERRIKDVALGDPRTEPIWPGAPFRGLESYEFDHAPIFFGRDAAVTKATEQFAANARSGQAFLLVSGASGSGKSSLVKAGVVPRLMKPQRISGVALLRRVVFRPGAEGASVVLAMARALTRAGEPDVGLPELIAPGQAAGELAAYLRGGAAEPGYLFANALGRLTETARKSGRLLAFEDAKLIIVVDQLEEIFTAPGIGQEERRLFIRLLAGLARSRAVWVIATLRADFWHRAAEIPELIALAEGQGRIDLAAPSGAELAEMIRKPAQAAGLTFEVHPQTGLGLDAVLAEHADTAPGALPLLSFTLDELYKDAKARGAGVLTHASYEALGGLQGSIAKRADDIVAALPPAAQAALPRVLRALTTVAAAADQAPVGRAAPLETFADGSPARNLVDAFTAARLLVAAGEGGASPTVRLAHEALISRWRRARDQLAADHRDLETRALVERQFGRWSQARRSGRRQLLLRNPDLANAVDLAKRWGDELDAPMRDFINRSVRRARLTQTLTAAAALLFAVVAGAAFYALRQAEQSREYVTLVSETLLTVAGFVPEETEALIWNTTNAVASGGTLDADAGTLKQVSALEEMARYFYDAWDGENVGKFLQAADERLRRVSSSGMASPEFIRLSAGSHEIAGDRWSDDDRDYARAVGEYEQALRLFEVRRAAESEGALASARVHRKLAALAVDKQDYQSADAHIAAASALLDGSDEALSERAALDDALAAEALRRSDFSTAQQRLEEAVALDRQLMNKARQAERPVLRLSASLAAHLQHLGDVLRRQRNGAARSKYDEAEMLAVEILETYPNQLGTRFMLDLIRHSRSLLDGDGLAQGDLAQQMFVDEARIDRTFSEWVSPFKFGMTPEQVNAQLDHPFGTVAPSGLPRAREYRTGEVRYFWAPIADLARFRSFYDPVGSCLDNRIDYVVFMFHENSLMRISFRLFGGAKPGCGNRKALLPELAERFGMPLLGTPKRWRLRWETKRVSVIGTMHYDGPMIDIIVR